MWNSDTLNPLILSQNDYIKSLNQSAKRDTELPKPPIVLYNTPNKAINLQSNPFPFDFNFFLGNLLTSEQKMPSNLDSTANKLQSNYLYKFDSSAESLTRYIKSNQGDLFKNYRDKMTPGSDMKIYQIPQANNNNQITKKNLFSTFENVQNESLTYIRKGDEQCYNEGDDAKNDNKDFLNSPPRNKVRNKKIFECSGNSTFCTTTQKKKKRFRKNRDQLKYLSVFYDKNKNWSKEQIKDISDTTGLKENKVYKWLWDQKNKDIKKAKFIVNK